MYSYEELSHYCKKTYERKLVFGTAGNISIRHGDYIAITPSGVSLNDVTPQNILDVDFEGNVIGNGRASMETFLHLGIYKNRNDIGAILHSHSPFLTTLAMKNKPIENYNIVELTHLFNGYVPIVSYNPPGSKELAQETQEVFKNNNAAILANHGAIAVGKTLEEAFYNYEALEYIAQVIVQSAMLKE